MTRIPPRLVLGSWRELTTVGVVAVLTGGYATVLILIAIIASSASDGLATLGVILGSVAVVFILIAFYVSTIVMANAVATVLAGRLRSLALLRLLGADARSLRRQIVRQAGQVALVGALIGAAAGSFVVTITRLILEAVGKIPAADYPIVSAWQVASTSATTLATVIAAILGSRAVLTVSPADAMRGPQPVGSAARRLTRRRMVAACLLVVVGAGLLAASMGLGGLRMGFPVAFLGGATASTGILIGARLFLPASVRLVARLLGRDPSAVIAGRNAVKDPDRTTGSTIGLAIGVGLVVTFASGLDALRAQVLHDDLTPEGREQALQILTWTEIVLIAVVIVSAVIAAVGFATTLSLTVLQRRREIGLLRALGFTRKQVRAMVTRESIAMSAAAIILGAVVGVTYGTIGARALLGGVVPGFTLGLPWLVLALVAVAGVVLVIVSARTPARRAVEVTPVEALRCD
jgi:putative ABC transport system permease protein